MSLLCHILSFLSTRDSVATGILSRRWRHLWKDLQVLYISDNPFYGPSREEVVERFVAFVNGVLAQRNNCHHIQKFHLLCEKTEQLDSIETWICTAATGPYLQELDLHLIMEDAGTGLTLPDCVFTSTSLVSFTLYHNSCFYHLPSVHLPSLKYLDLDPCLEDIDKILSGCPVLETLKLIIFVSDYVTIHMPRSLKSLTFELDFIDGGIEHLEIDTPYLEYLHIISNVPGFPILSTIYPNMVEAHLDICQDVQHVSWVKKLLRALCRTKLLVLYDRTIESLVRAPTLDFPGFCCLVNLELYMPCFIARFVIDLLRNCHMLQVIKIDNHNSKTLQHVETSGWILPTTVPNCVISQLKNFKFERYQDSADEHAFTAYILQRGLVLKTMTIHTSSLFDLKEKHDILKKLSSIPRGSNTCQLNFQ